MKFSEQWLREWVNPAVTTAELAHQLTMAGLEVDAIESVAPLFSGVVVGKVMSVVAHPDADKLRCCEVDVGDEILSIVCGAPNVYVGMTTATAKIGAVLPGDFKIKKSKLRGQPSHGMLCSASELGLSEESSGLIDLPSTLTIGADIRSELGLDDHTIELGLTPNRADCLSVAGIAREVAVLQKMEVNRPDTTAVKNSIDSTFPIRVDAPDLCPRYVGRVISGLNRNATTPLWMQERLRRSGIRSLGPLVDVTNYLLLEFGQPMHAFALDKLQQTIIVRRAVEGEKLTLLNGNSIELRAETLVIADQRGAVALAGIMGGEATAVDDTCCDVLLESAFFTPAALAGKARSYGLHTDSSHRFERGVDPMLQRHAMERATDLLLQICGGSAGPVVEIANEATIPQPRNIRLRIAKVRDLLGISEIDVAEIDGIFRQLGFSVTASSEIEMSVTVPQFRFDIAIEVDLIEEIGRIKGYDQIPVTPMPMVDKLPLQPESALSDHEFKQVLVQRGYHEVISYSFVEPELQQLLDKENSALVLQNPISADMSAMRTSLWPGLLGALRYNLFRQQDRLRLFEVGLRFIEVDGELLQEKMIAGVITGKVNPEQWGMSASNADFFDLKGDVEALLQLIGDRNQWVFSPQASETLHSGQSATIYHHGQAVGQLGMLHPGVIKKLQLPEKSFVFELQLSALQHRTVPQFAELSKFPAVKRDLAFIVANEVHASELLDAVHTVAPPALANVELFDLYQGENVGEGRKSLAIRLTLQAESKTLTDEEVDNSVEQVVSYIRQTFDAVIRE